MNPESASWLNSKEGPKRSSNSEKAWSSVAFQEHLAHQYQVNLSIPRFRPNKGKSDSQSRSSKCSYKSNSRSLRNSSKPHAGNEEPTPLNLPGSEIEYPLADPSLHQPSLAQKLGLVEGPPPLLSEEQWEQIKEKSNRRLDSTNPCPICKDHFQLLPQLLLSCSHIFHKSCIESYEKFVKRRMCPVCRCEGYQGRVVYEGAKHTRDKAATLIQSCWRGHRAKLEFRKLQEKHPPTHPALRRKFFSRKLATLTDLYMDQCEKREQEIDTFIDELDNTLRYSRRTLENLEQHLNSLNPSEWLSVREKAMRRGDNECPICLTLLFSSKHVSLLSCSHMFHCKCLESFEQFATFTPFACPVCRSAYQKIIITQKPNT